MTEQFRWKTVEADGQQTLFASEADEQFERRKGIGEFRGLEFLHVRAKRIINEVPGPSPMPFRFTINCYRGCSHACTYCFARPTHEYLNLNLAEDFEQKIVVKINAVERVRTELRSAKWCREGIAMGTNTDPYQRAEGRYRLTRGVIQELGAARNDFSILTKGTLITRDVDLLIEAAQHADVKVNFSIPTIDESVWRSTEPGTPHPLKRIEALRKLTDAGLECGVLMAPILPGLSDSREQMNNVVERCVDAGANWIAASALHLRRGVEQHWMKWLMQTHPQLVRAYQSKYAGGAYLTAEERQHVASQAKQLVARRKGEAPEEA
jgi:DNA repair photolyase